MPVRDHLARTVRQGAAQPRFVFSLLGLLAGCGGGGAKTFEEGPGSTATATPTPTPTIAAAVRLVFVQQPTVRAAGTRAEVTISLGTAPPGAVLLGTTTRNAVAGLATFDDLRLSLAGDFTLACGSPGLEGATSVAFVTDPLSLAYATAQNLGAGNGPISVAVGDLNADGKPDLVTANYYSDSGCASWAHRLRPLARERE